MKYGTGITEGQEQAFCPYCRRSREPSDFMTNAQREYAQGILENDVIDGVDRMFKKALGFGPSRKKTIGGGPLSTEMSYKPPRKRPVGRPFEEELQRDIRFPHCTLEHAVFGLATWCPDCGADIFLAHLEAELDVIRKMLSQVETRTKELGRRVGARDIENALEDTVSIFEAVLKFITRRHLKEKGTAATEIEEIFRNRVRNTYQSVFRGGELFEELVGFPMFNGLDQVELERLAATFEKRYPITHNLGVLDRKYLEKVRSGELEGREVRVTVTEVEGAMAFISTALAIAYNRAFSPQAPRTSP